jgi:molecular chaperone DnaK (HSP70)
VLHTTLVAAQNTGSARAGRATIRRRMDPVMGIDLGTTFSAVALT